MKKSILCFSIVLLSATAGARDYSQEMYTQEGARYEFVSGKGDCPQNANVRLYRLNSLILNGEDLGEAMSAIPLLGSYPSPFREGVDQALIATDRETVTHGATWVTDTHNEIAWNKGGTKMFWKKTSVHFQWQVFPLPGGPDPEKREIFACYYRHVTPAK